MALRKFYNVGYGEYKCSCCGKILTGSYMVIGEEKDEDGYAWRGFCKECETELEGKTNKQLYKKFKECEYALQK